MQRVGITNLKQEQPSPALVAVPASQLEEACSKKTTDDIGDVVRRPEEGQTNSEFTRGVKITQV